jgi:chromate reductase
MRKLKIVAISGSLRADSFNQMLIHALDQSSQAGCTFSHISLRDIPVYNQDDEDEMGIPSLILEIQSQLMECDGLLIASPEYNHSIPGVLKNAFDWLTRPAEKIETVFRDLPVGVVGVTPGKGGTVLAQKAWQPIIQTLGMRPFKLSSLALSDAERIFSRSGELIDEQVQGDVEHFMKGYTQFIRDNTRNSLPDYYYRSHQGPDSFQSFGWPP